MNNEKTLDFENMTMKQICSCLGLLNKLVEENIIKFDINKSEAVLNYDEAVRCIEKQNKLYKSTLDKIKEILKSNIIFYEENFKLSNMTAEEFKKEHPYILGSYDDSKNLLERINELLEEIE